MRKRKKKKLPSYHNERAMYFIISFLDSDEFIAAVLVQYRKVALGDDEAGIRLSE